jgi:hypothetical protein
LKQFAPLYYGFMAEFHPLLFTWKLLSNQWIDSHTTIKINKILEGSQVEVYNYKWRLQQFSARNG